MYRMQHSMNRLLDGFFANRSYDCDGQCEWTPAVDISENKDQITIKADVPGMDKNDIKVVVHEDTLTLKGERKSEKTEEGANYYRMERTNGSFYRSFSLPSKVDAGKIKANYQSGVLEIVLPKVEEAKPKEIDVSVN